MPTYAPDQRAGFQERLCQGLMDGESLDAICATPGWPSRPTLRSALGLKRWRKADPEFDSALRGAMIVGHKARGRARTEARCSPRLRRRIAERILAGASLHSLYKWVRERPDFAQDIALACRFRDEILLDGLLDLARLAVPGDGALIARETGAIAKRLGQLRPYPGERRRE